MSQPDPDRPQDQPPDEDQLSKMLHPKSGHPKELEEFNGLEFDSDLIPPLDSVGPRQRMPQRGARKRILGTGEGDFCIYTISDGTHAEIPAGALLPVPGVPRFASAKEAKRWLAASSGDLLANRQVMIFKAVEIINVITQVTTKIDLVAKSKISVPPRQETMDG